MQYPCLLTSDLHLVASESTSYRWGLFDWLVAEARAEKVKSLYILGDLTDAKDNHNADLVNKVVHSIWMLSQVVPDIKILTGNHDWLLDGQEYFRFLDRLDGGRVKFITRPYEDEDVKGPSAFFLPYSKQPAKDWAGFDFSHYEYLFMQKTVKNAVSSNGQVMDGEDLPPLNAGKVYSGDIHVPQIIGGVEYVGSPYHVHFGDAFTPRCVLLERGGNPVNLYFKTLQRVTLAVQDRLVAGDLTRAKLRKGDQVKLRIKMSEADKHSWSKTRREAVALLRDYEIIIAGVELIVEKTERSLADGGERKRIYTPEQTITRFVEAEELGPLAYELGMRVIES
jgi:hypothetical protein